MEFIIFGNASYTYLFGFISIQWKGNILISEQISQVGAPWTKPDQIGVPNQVENRNFTLLLIK
jgi:hypothetical protein